MAAFFVTGSGTDIGKTWICAGLLAFWRARGLRPAALKPVVSGYDEDAPHGSDPAVLLAALGRTADRDALRAIAPFRFRAPLSPDQAAALEGRSLTTKDVVRACRAAMQEAEGPLLIEGAGGVMSPLNEHDTMLDLAAGVGVPVVFVAGSYLGAISHALTGLAALQTRGLAVAAVVINESAAGSVGLAETVSSVARHCRGAPVSAVSRGADAAAWAQISATLDLDPYCGPSTTNRTP
jgi:dethiobiotin synthetase